MATILKNATVYSPKFLGKKDIKVIDGIIIEINSKIPIGIDDKVVNLNNKIITPMFVDGHEHLVGNIPRTLHDFILNGIDSVIGVMGDESDSIKLLEMYNNTKYLNEHGINAFCLTGGKQYFREKDYPLLTIGGKTCSDDIIKKREVIGIKTALSSKYNKKSSNPTYEELKKIAIECKNANNFCKKQVQLHIHLDKLNKTKGLQDKDNLNWIDQLVAETGLSYNMIKIAHIQKFPNKITEYSNKGCFLDFTASKNESRIELLSEIIKNKSNNLNFLSISSDAISLDRYSDDTNSEFNVLLRENLVYLFRKLITKYSCKIEEVLPLFTTNVSSPFNLDCGKIECGSKANLNIFNKKIEHVKVCINGKFLKTSNTGK